MNNLSVVLMSLLVGSPAWSQSGTDTVRVGHAEMSRSRYEELLDPKNVLKTDKDGYTHLHTLAVLGDVVGTETLIRAGARINARGYAGSPLTWAAQFLEVETIEVLLRHGANPNIGDHVGATPMVEALWSRPKHPETEVDVVRQEKVIDLLLAAKADLNLPNAWGWYPLCLEVFNRERRRKFLAHGANPNLRVTSYQVPEWQEDEKKRDKSRGFKIPDVTNSPMTCASSRYGLHMNTFADVNEAIVDLLRAGARVDSRDDNTGLTALMNAAGNDNVDGVRILLAAGARANAKNNFGQNALMIAALRLSDPRIIEILLPLTDLKAKDVYNRTILDYFVDSKIRQDEAEQKARWTRLGYTITQRRLLGDARGRRDQLRTMIQDYIQSKRGK